MDNWTNLPESADFGNLRACLGVAWVLCVDRQPSWTNAELLQKEHSGMGGKFFPKGILTALAGLAITGHAWAQGVTQPVTEHLDHAEHVRELPVWWWAAPICAVIALVMAFVFYKGMMKASEGNDRMKEIAQHVRDGAMAYLKRQYYVVAIFFAVVCVVLFVMGRMGLQC
jgi:preprotein translocase subunit SecG